MDFANVLTAISSVGFPIVACGAMAWYVKYQTDKNTEQMAKITEEHKNEMQEVTTALNNNTLAIQTLCERLGN